MQEKDIRIAVLQRGWVVLGIYRREGSEVVIDGGYNVRRWGTTEGLGQLAMDGRQDGTRLDPLPNGTRFPHHAEIMTIPIINDALRADVEKRQ